jgi:hypothetical protein
MDNLKIEIAKTLAIAQSSQQVRDFLLRQARLEIPGEPSVLWMMVRDSVVHTNGSTFASWMAQASQSTPNTRDSLFYSDTLPNLIPDLSFTFFVDYEEEEQEIHDWSYDAPILIAPATSQFQSAEGYNTPYFDNTLNVTYLSNKEDPSVPVLYVEDHPYLIPIDVISKESKDGRPLNEVLSQLTGRDDLCTGLLVEINSLFNQLNSDPMVFDEHGNIVLVIDPHNTWALLFNTYNNLLSLYEDNCDEEPGGSADPGGSCDRDSREKVEQVTQAQFFHKVDVKEFCRFPRSFCRIRFNPVFFKLDPDGVTVLQDGDLTWKNVAFPRRKLKRLKVTPAYDDQNFLWHWDFLSGKHADVAYYQLQGVNPSEGDTKGGNFSLGTSTNVGFKIGPINVGTSINPSQTFTYQTREEDFELSRIRVDYCDDANGVGTEYNTNMVKVWIKEVQ